ncbi:MAG: hypothetical protein QNJ38_10550 [Prochloraceae cyanobacterium]|nr:hypothetical protein [Prochloraceae cyanobacterium]
MTKSQKKLCGSREQTSNVLYHQSALNLPAVNNNTQINFSIDLLPQIANKTAEISSTETILQAVLIADDPPKPKNWSDRILTPLGIAGSIIFVSANIILFNAISEPNKPTIATIKSEPSELSSVQTPNLSEGELTKLDLQNIINLKPQAAESQAIAPQTPIKVKVIPGAYSDLATALLPPSLRPYLYKSHILEPISARDLPHEVNLQKLR